MARRILRHINTSALALLQTFDLQERYRAIVHEASSMVKAEYGSIFIANDKTKLFERVYTSVPRSRQVDPNKVPYAYEAFKDFKIRVIPSSKIKKEHKKLYAAGVRSIILIPLVAKNQKVGILALQSTISYRFSDLQLQVLNVFATLSTLAIRNAHFYIEAQKSIHERDLFISLAAHELKTPLTTITVYADQIEKRIRTKQIPSQESIQIICSEAKRLKHIVNELLTFDSISSNQLRYKWRDVNLLEVVKRSIINFKTVNPRHKVLLQNNVPRGLSIIQGDGEKLQQVFSNILNNSAKFSPPHIPILVSMDRQSKKVTVTITDYGKGIKKIEQGKIFNEFYKAEGNRKDGLGLGLYLVKQIVEKHKGRIIVTSKVKKGTTVAVELPLKLY